MDEHTEAGRIAEAAGRLLLRLRSRVADPAALRDRADAESNTFIVDELAAAFPDDPVLSEEQADDGSRLTSERVWIVDPLDGTREYGEPGRTDWAVHVALVERGRAVAGAVALPARDMLLSTASVTAPPVPQPGAPPRLVVSRSRPPAVAGVIREAVGGVLVPLGSAGAKAAAVVLGEAEVYAHAGGQHEWDSAAPVAVAAAVGLHVSRLDGSPLVYNRSDPWLPDLLVCRAEMATAVLEAVRSMPGRWDATLRA